MNEDRVPAGREKMSSDQTIQLFSQLMWNAALIAAPLLLTTLVVGLLVSVFQAVTQIQEMSLTFIPKLLAAGIVLVAAGPWMLNRLVAYSASLIAGIPRYF
jgi:flagellar biosynthetic protein FliQ